MLSEALKLGISLILLLQQIVSGQLRNILQGILHVATTNIDHSRRKVRKLRTGC